MKVIERIVKWLALSSKNSNQMSLFFTNALVYMLAHFGLGQFDLNEGMELFQQSVEAASLILGLYGAWRKAVRSWRGKNEVVNDPAF